MGALTLVRMLDERDVKILELAEQLEGKPSDALRARAVAELGMSGARYVQRLLHLIIQPKVVADPRWTMLCHRVQDVAFSRAETRGRRTFKMAV